MRAPGLWLAVEAAAVFVAAWLAPATVFLAGRGGLGVWRVASLPDAWWTATSVALAAGGAGALAWLWKRRQRPLAELAARLKPLVWLHVLALPFLPLVGDLVPAANAFAGPLRWSVVSAVALAFLWPAADARWAGWASRIAPRPLVLVTVAFLVYAGLGRWVTSDQLVGGDEPHYLIIVESLLRDGDLRVENNYDNRDYSSFLPIDLPPHFQQRGVNDVMYSVHAPGLPALVLPAYAVGGRVAVNLFMGFLAAITSLGIFRLAEAFAGTPAAVVTWLGVAFTTPFVMHGWLIYPEMAAACIVAWALWWTWQGPSASAGVWLLRGLALGYLPWLHTKFSVLLAGFAVVVGVRLIRQPRQLVAFVAPIALSVGLWLYSFYVMYGVADPTAAYGGPAGLSTELAWANVPRGILGLLFDGRFGLLLYSPFYLVTASGLMGLRRRRDTWGVLAALVLAGGAFLLGTTRFYMWWGGWSVPARFAIPLLPMLVPFVAVGISRLSVRPAGRVFVAVTLLTSLATTVVLVASPTRELAFSVRTAPGKFLHWLQGTTPLTPFFPSLWRFDWLGELPRVATFVGGLCAGVAALWYIGRRLESGSRASGQLVPGFVVMTLAGSFLTAGLAATPPAVDEALKDSQLALLDDWSGRPMVDVSRVRRISGRALVQRLDIPLATELGTPPDDPMAWLGPWDLPPGDYELRLWHGAPATGGEFVVWPNRTPAVVARASGASGMPTVLRFSLPAEVAVPPLWVGASSPALIAETTRVSLVPRAVIPRAERHQRRPLAFDSVQGRAGAYLASFDRNALMEGGVFWTRGESATDLVLLPAGASAMQVLLHPGAAGGTATFSIEGVPTTWQLAPWEERTLDVVLRPTDQAVPLRVEFSGGFRPRDVEPGSKDNRWLGLRVKITVR